MRIWSLHPKYLDTKGLVALWRETLLAKNVLEGNTKGYKNHPQLIRFKETINPLGCINYYLSVVFEESIQRGYNFTKDKVDWNYTQVPIIVTSGQVEYEKIHLLNKLAIRDISAFNKLSILSKIETHPLFTLLDGEIAHWEKL